MPLERWARGGGGGDVKQCGDGGFGTVFIVQLPDSGARLAIKCSQNVMARSDFDREVALWRAWSSACPTYVMPLCGAQFVATKRAKGYAYYAMPAVEGKYADLLEKVFNDKKRRHRSPNLPLYHRSVLAVVLLALDAGHEQGIAWLDLKPENILLKPNGAPRIADFGTARRVPMQRDPGMASSRAYVAPECVSKAAGPITGAADMWSFGVLALEMCSEMTLSDLRACCNKRDVLQPAAAAQALAPGALPAPLRSLVFDHLLVADPAKRMTAAETMTHPYFGGVDWEDLRAGK